MKISRLNLEHYVWQIRVHIRSLILGSVLKEYYTTSLLVFL